MAFVDERLSSLWQKQDGGTAGGLGTHDEYLRNVGGLRGTADEGAVAVVLLVKLNALVGFVHVVYDLRLW